MATPIPYALINGVRHSFASLTFKLDGQEFVGFSKVDYSRKRERGMPYGPNPDALGKTRGQNKYTFKVTVYTAEFLNFVTAHFGPGYGDAQFVCQLSINENGMDPQSVMAINCTIDESTVSASAGVDATTVDLDFGPTKLIFNDTDDNSTPLGGAAAA
jgi:hypothetical protein